MKVINIQEIKYIFLATLFSFILFVLIIPNVLPNIDNLSPFVQFLIFNVGIFVLLQIYFKGIATDKKAGLKKTIGLVLLFMAIDIMVPPLMVNPEGVLSNNVILGSSASDYTFGLLGQQFGLTGFILYLFVYIVSPFVLLLLSSIILKNSVNSL